MSRQVRTFRGAVYERGYRRDWRIADPDAHHDRVRVEVGSPPKNSPSFVANQPGGVTSHHPRAQIRHRRFRPPTSSASRPGATAVVATLWARVGTRHTWAPRPARRA